MTSESGSVFYKGTLQIGIQIRTYCKSISKVGLNVLFFNFLCKSMNYFISDRSATGSTKSSFCTTCHQATQLITIPNYKVKAQFKLLIFRTDAKIAAASKALFRFGLSRLSQLKTIVIISFKQRSFIISSSFRQKSEIIL